MAKGLKLIAYILKHGSLKRTTIDFQKRRDNTLSTYGFFPKSIITVPYFLLRVPILGSIIENIYYLLRNSRIHKKYFVVDSLRLVYIRLFKTGSVSVLKAILPLIDSKIVVDQLNDSQIDELGHALERNKLSESEKNYAGFVVVRNPLRRILSAYLDVFKANGEFVYQNYLFGILKKEMSFAEVVKVLEVIPPRLLPPHFNFQSDVLILSGIKNIDVFKIESDTMILEEFLANRNFILEHRNQSASYELHKYYDRDLAQRVYSLYLKDIEQFKYEEDCQQIIAQLKD